MSAFIVGEGTMNTVVSAIMEHGRLSVRFEYFAGIDTRGPRAGEVIGTMLYDLNRAAVSQRYKQQEIAPPFVFYFRLAVPKIQRFKAVECLLYQCAEGDCPSHPHYQALETFKNQLMAWIIRGDPAYEKAAWDE